MRLFGLIRGFSYFSCANKLKIQMQYTLFDLDSPIFTKLYLFKNSTKLGRSVQVAKSMPTYTNEAFWLHLKICCPVVSANKKS